MLGAIGLFTACEKSDERAVFETPEAQNSLLEQWDYEIIPGQYIITLNEGTLETPPTGKGAVSYKNFMESSKLQLMSLFSKSNLSDDQVKALYGYTIEGFAATLSDEQLRILREDP